jgi:hypothetical protein
VDARLRFALRLTSGELPLAFDSGHRFNLKFEALAAVIRAFLYSFHHNKDLAELLDNISNGNVRLVLDLIQQFFGSGHVDTERIYTIYRDQGFYFVAVHEFIRAIMYGDSVFYEPNRTPFANIFDLTRHDKNEHVIIPILIGTVNTLRSSSGTEGFVDTKPIYGKMQALGFLPDQIEHAIVRCCQKKLLEATARRMPEPGSEMPSMLRPTSVGLYHISKLCTYFTYYDAIIVDLPILEPETKRGIKLVETLPDRLHRVSLLKAYLTRCWATVSGRPTGFDWVQISKGLEEDMVRVEENYNARSIPWEESIRTKRQT